MSSTASGTGSRPATTASQASRQSAPAAASGGASRAATTVAAPAAGVIHEERQVDLLARGGTVYTGPDGQRPHRMKVIHPDYEFVGEGDRSNENTGGVAYLFRGAKDTPFPRAKGAHIGEIGWSAKSLAPPTS